MKFRCFFISFLFCFLFFGITNCFADTQESVTAEVLLSLGGNRTVGVVYSEEIYNISSSVVSIVHNGNVYSLSSSVDNPTVFFPGEYEDYPGGVIAWTLAPGLAFNFKVGDVITINYSVPYEANSFLDLIAIGITTVVGWVGIVVNSFIGEAGELSALGLFFLIGASVFAVLFGIKIIRCLFR